MRKLLAILLPIMLMLCTCVKPPSYPVAPIIDFRSVSADTVVNGQGVYVVVGFQDGDGDLGTDANDVNPVTGTGGYTDFKEVFDTACANPGNFDLFVVDSRTNPDPIHAGKKLFNIAPYQIPIIPAKGTSKAISGDVTFFINDIQKIPGAALDTLSFLIMMRDQGGHCSNIVRTSVVHIQ